MMLLSNGWCHGLAHDAHNNNIARAKDVLPNICRTQAPGITPGNDGVVPFTAAARCLQRAHTICMLLAVTPALSAFFIPGDLDLDIRQSKGPNTSSLWIWRKSVQRLPRYCETLVTCDAAWLQFFLSLQSWRKSIQQFPRYLRHKQKLELNVFYQTYSERKLPKSLPSPLGSQHWLNGVFPAAAGCLQRAHAICILPAGNGSTKHIFCPW